ncbi:MAG: hypothetical protein ACLPTZ_11450 [Beijerinckiaceae bacterium]
MTQVNNETSNEVVAQPSPGYLMAPFGWAAKPLAQSVLSSGAPPLDLRPEQLQVPISGKRTRYRL